MNGWGEWAFRTLGVLVLLLTISRPVDAQAGSPGPASAAIDPSGSSDVSCHGDAHEVGAAIAGRAATLTEAMLACRDQCTFGCVHGAFRAYFSTRLNQAGTPGVSPEVRREILDLCREDSTILPGFFRGNCAHSAGHALNASAPDPRTAVVWCRLFETAEMRFYCETGVFMDGRHAIRALFETERLSVAERARAAIASCRTQGGALAACLRFTWRPTEDLAVSRDVVRACRLGDEASRKACAWAAGFAVRGYVAAHPEAIASVCGAALAGDRAFCVAGIALMKKDHVDRAALPALCRSLDDPGLRATCEDQAARFYYQLGNPTLSAAVLD